MSRPLRLQLPRTAGAVALAWAVAAFLGVAALAGGPGVAAPEAALREAARGAPPEVGPLPGPLAVRATQAIGGLARAAGVEEVRADRLASALFAALLAALLALLGLELAGVAGAALAPALYLAAPRLLHLSVTAAGDTAAAALALVVVWTYRRAALLAGRNAPRDGARRLGLGVLGGVAFGLALAARLDAWILLPVLALHTVVVRLVRRGPTPRAAAAPAPSGGAPGAAVPRDTGAAPTADAVAADLEARLHGVPLALAAIAVIGPLVAAALWPSLVAHPVQTAAAALRPAPGLTWLGAPLEGPPPPLGYPLLLTALATPAALLLAWTGGAVHGLARLVRGLRRDPGVDGADELLLLLAAAAPFAAAQLGLAPLAGGLRPWVAGLPFLALLGARALLAAARVAWPARAGSLAASLALLVVYPGLRGAGHAWPAASASWGELAGGAPGAASLGLQRQEPGEAAAAVLAAVNERARAGARVLWLGVPSSSVEAYARDGRLRADLAPAADALAADVIVAVLDGGSRDAEYQGWSALRTARPVDGVFLDEVPLALIYARPGAWR